MQHIEMKYLGGKKFIAENRRHVITVDLPGEFGGSDEGPSAPELFMDSLASCIGVYVIGYCGRVGLDTKDLSIKVGWEKELSQKPSYIKKIDIKISLPNADVGKRREALLKIARSCLIHQTIRNQPEVTIDLA